METFQSAARHRKEHSRSAGYKPILNHHPVGALPLIQVSDWAAHRFRALEWEGFWVPLRKAYVKNLPERSCGPLLFPGKRKIPRPSRRWLDTSWLCSWLWRSELLWILLPITRESLDVDFPPLEPSDEDSALTDTLAAAGETLEQRPQVSGAQTSDLQELQYTCVVLSC